jgi:xanthine dehydrogenase accessory factor
MAFTDAVFDGAALLEGIRAVRVDGPLLVPARSDSISVSVHDFDELVQALRPDVLIDARMRKRQTPEAQIKLAKCTIGLGPNFVAQETTHFVIETGWAENRGAVITQGSASQQHGAPRALGGFGIERVVYAPAEGTFKSDFDIGDDVTAGQLVAHIGPHSLTAPLGGRLRGLTHTDVPVRTGTKVIEIDPRGDAAVIAGIGERPAKIAEGTLRALRAFVPRL